MEELAERGAERGTPGYVPESGNVKRSWDVADGGVEAAYSPERGSAAAGLGAEGRRKGKRERVASKEMCTFT